MVGMDGDLWGSRDEWEREGKEAAMHKRQCNNSIDYDTVLPLGVFCSYLLTQEFFHMSRHRYSGTHPNSSPASTPYQQHSLPMDQHSCSNNIMLPFLILSKPGLLSLHQELLSTELCPVWPMGTRHTSVLIQSNISACFGVLCSMSQQEQLPDCLATCL